VKLGATVDPQEVGIVDVVLVQTKARHTAEAMQTVRCLFGEDTVAISFQNGLGNEEVIAEVFTKAGLDTAISDNIMKDIWKKLLANIGINAISALCNFRVGEIFDTLETKETILEALDEAALVAEAEGVEVNVDKTKEVLYKITGKGGTGSNRSGMLMDVLNQRKTEIDFINGAIVRLGKKHGIPTPVNKTLTAAVKGLERHFD